MSGQRPPARRRLSAARLPLAALAMLTGLSIMGVFYTPHTPALRVDVALRSATWAAWIGTDEIGRDLLSRLWVGMAMLWLPSLGVVAVSAVAGCLLGTIAGMASGWLGRLAHVPINLLRALPAPVMALAAAASVGPGLGVTAAALALFGWPWYARMVRAEILAARQTPFGEAARLTAPGRLFYFLPAALPRLAIAATFDLGNTVLLLALMSFAGLGDPAPAAELGAMTHNGIGFVLDYPRVALLPGLLVFGMALTANLAGAAFRRSLVRA